MRVHSRVDAREVSLTYLRQSRVDEFQRNCHPFSDLTESVSPLARSCVSLLSHHGRIRPGVHSGGVVHHEGCSPLIVHRQSKLLCDSDRTWPQRRHLNPETKRNRCIRARTAQLEREFNTRKFEKSGRLVEGHSACDFQRFCRNPQRLHSLLSQSFPA